MHDEESFRPPISDHRFWSEQAAPLREFLSETRSWKDLRAWAKANKRPLGLIRHTLAWLEHNNAVLSEEREAGEFYWIMRPSQRCAGEETASQPALAGTSQPRRSRSYTPPHKQDART